MMASHGFFIMAAYIRFAWHGLQQEETLTAPEHSGKESLVLPLHVHCFIFGWWTYILSPFTTL